MQKDGKASTSIGVVELEKFNMADALDEITYDIIRGWERLPELNGTYYTGLAAQGVTYLSSNFAKVATLNLSRWLTALANGLIS